MTCPLCEREATPEGESHGHGFCVPSRPTPIGNNLQRRQCAWCRGIFTVTIRGKLGRKSDYCKPDCRRLATNKMIAESKRRAALRGHPSPIVDALTDGMFRAAFQATPNVLALRAFIGGGVDAIRERARRLGLSRPRGRPVQRA